MLKLSRRCRLFRPLTYSSVQIAENNGEGYEVLIDGRKLRVPRTMEVLKIQSKDVAEIVGLEWAGQKYRDLTQIQKHTLYVTQLCYAQHELSQTTEKTDLIPKMLKYLQTDTCLFRAPFSDDHSLDGSPSKKLNDMQDEFYGPVQEWFENRFEVKVEPAKGFRLPTVTDDTFEKLEKYFNTFDVGTLIVIEKMLLALKSVMLTAMVIERKIDVREAVRLSRLENEYQKETWGTVEYHHTVEEHDLNAKVAAQALWIRFTVEDIDADPKPVSTFV